MPVTVSVNDRRAAEGSQSTKARRAQHRQSRCVMVLPADLEGRRVLDIACRRGLGAFKIADRVGKDSFVVGADPSPQCVEAAVAQAPDHHWAGPDWGDHLQFVCAGPCGLEAAGLQAASFDVVVVNSALNLEPDYLGALAAIARLLVPGGYLYHDAVLAEESLAEPVSRLCRDAGNVFGCAPTQARLADALARAGFCRWSFEAVRPLEPPSGDVRPELEGYGFQSAVVQAFVPGP